MAWLAMVHLYLKYSRMVKALTETKLVVEDREKVIQKIMMSWDTGEP